MPQSHRLTTDPIEQLGKRLSLDRNEKIFRKGGRATSIYKVDAGCIRTYAKLNGGERGDLSFYFPGDYFGLETRDEHRIFAEATTASSLTVIRRGTLNARARTDISIAKFLHEVTNRELQRMQDYRLMLYLSANDRVAQFLLNLKKRNGKVVEL